MKHLIKFAPAFVVLFVGILISIWIQSMYKKSLLIQKENEINVILNNKYRDIQRELIIGFSSVEILQYIFHKHETISKNEFNSYTAPLFNGNPGIKALSWVPKITDDKRKKFELTLSKGKKITERNSQFEIVSRNKNSFYFPVLFIEPFKENESALGFDIYSNQVRKKAIDLAISEGKLNITSGIKLVQDTSGYSFLALAPVFYTTEKSHTIENVKGVISAVFKVEDLVNNALSKDIRSNFDLIIFDITGDKRECVYGDLSLLEKPNTLIQKKILPIGGRSWELNFILGPVHFKVFNSWAYLGAGITISFLLFILLMFPFIKDKRNSLLSKKLIKEQGFRKDAEISLSESEEYNRMLFEQSVIGLAVTTIDGKLVDVNSAYAKTIGRTIEETLELSYWDITPEKYAEQEQMQLKSLNSIGSYGPYEKEYIHKTGSLIPVRLQGKIIIRKGVKYIWSSVENITEKKNAERKIKASENKHRALVEQSITGIYIFEKDKFLYVNKRFTEIFGYTEQEIMSSLKPTDVVIPEERPAAQENIDKRLEGKIDSVHYIARGKHKTNKELWVEIHGTHIMLDGKDVITGTVLDITNRKIAEEVLRENEIKFRSVFENSIDAIGVSKSGIHVFVNPAYLKLFGYKNNEELSQKSIVDLISPAERIKILENVKNREKGALVPYSYETIGLRKDGSEFDMDVHVSEYTLNNETYTLVILRDISDRKKAEADLKENEELLRLSSELANVAAWEYNFETNSMSRSRNHDKLYGLEIQDKWKFETFVEATHPEDREYSNQMIQNSVDIGGPDDYKFDFRVVFPDKTVHWLEVIGQVIERNKKGEGILVRGFLIEITDRKSAEEEIKKLNEELEKGVEDRTQKLEEKVKEVERMNKLFVGRELRMTELKQKIKELEQESKRK